MAAVSPGKVRRSAPAPVSLYGSAGVSLVKGGPDGLRSASWSAAPVS